MFRVQSGADDKLFIMFIVLQKKSGKIMNLDRFSVQKKNKKTQQNKQMCLTQFLRSGKTRFLHLTSLETSVFKYYQRNCGLVVVYVLLGLHLLALASVLHTVNITHRC